MIAATALLAGGLAGCATPKGNTAAEKRLDVMAMHDEVVDGLSAERAGFRARLDQAPGYAVFSNISTKVLFVGGGNGYGVLVNNQSGDRTFMRMAEIGAGLGVGVKDWRAVFVFNNPKAMYMFIQEGWEFGGDADAAFKVGEGGAAAGDAFAANDVDVYQFTNQGVALQAMLNGTRFWRDTELNGGTGLTAPSTTVAGAETTGGN
jgi:lipid-binding SYLF domain-containing protein